MATLTVGGMGKDTAPQAWRGVVWAVVALAVAGACPRAAAAGLQDDAGPRNGAEVRGSPHEEGERPQGDEGAPTGSADSSVERSERSARSLAGFGEVVTEVPVPSVPSFWERQRKIVDSVKIVVYAVVVYHLVGLVLWLVRLGLVSVSRSVGRAPSSAKRVATLMSFATSLAKVLVVVFSIVAVFNAFGVEPAKAGGAIGLIGLIMAGMFQQIVIDFVKGADIVFGNHFHVGDFVEVDGKYGHVVNLNVKHTRIRTFSGEELNIPNSRCIPSRRFPDGYMDQYVDVVLKSAADEERGRAAIDALCPDLNRRVEPLHEQPACTECFAGPQGRVTLRYRLRVLPGCERVATERFVPAVKDALAAQDVELAGEPSLFVINRVETFRKLFSRKLTEEEIIRETSDEEGPSTEVGGATRERSA